MFISYAEQSDVGHGLMAPAEGEPLLCGYSPELNCKVEACSRSW